MYIGIAKVIPWPLLEASALSNLDGQAICQRDARITLLWIGTLLVGMAATWLIHDGTNLDIRLQDQWYDFDANRWLVDKHASMPRLIFYLIPKASVIVLGIVLGVWSAFHMVQRRAWRLRQRRRLFLLLCLILVPLTVSLGKTSTGIFCPCELARYGGDHALQTLNFAFSRPAGKAGHCFPAGHASAGFSLMGLYFMSGNTARRRMGLTVGLALGWIMGLYQMLKGVHFLTHTLMTMFLAGLWVVLLARLLRVDRREAKVLPEIH